MSPKSKCIVLLSGGLDSTVALAETLEQNDVALTLTFNYGQRAGGKEIRASRQISEHYGVKHEVTPLPWLSGFLPRALQIRNWASKPPSLASWQVDSSKNSEFFEADPVWVPNRNGVFLSIAASYAEAMGADTIVFGANAEEAEHFPDNSEAFCRQMNATLAMSTRLPVQVQAPLVRLTKPEIVRRAIQLEVPLYQVWSCYTEGPEQCGICPSCYRLKQALQSSPKDFPYREAIAFAH